jgi:hypothetical protein
MKQSPGGDYRNVDSGELVEKGDSSIYPDDKFGKLTAMKKFVPWVIEFQIMWKPGDCHHCLPGFVKACVGGYGRACPLGNAKQLPTESNPSLLNDVEAWRKQYGAYIEYPAMKELLAILDKHRGAL